MDASINWMGPQKFLSVELNTGTGYQMLGNPQLLSVPYANLLGAFATLKNVALPVFPGNAAAIAGGLLPGSLYHTSSGVLMIVY
jgi:hypothetical protein